MKTFETPSFKMHVHDDLLIEFIVKKNVKLQESDIWESKKLSLDYLPGKKFVVLMESEGYMDELVCAFIANEERERIINSPTLIKRPLICEENCNPAPCL